MANELTQQSALAHLKDGGQITNGIHWMWIQSDGSFHFECEDSVGCCNDEIDGWEEAWRFMLVNSPVRACIGGVK